MKKKIYKSVGFLSTLVLATGMILGMTGCENKKEEAVTIPVEVGEHMTIGSWQGEAIDWYVLDVQGENVLLLSEYALDVQPYNDTQDSNLTWENCSLRQWLNGEFYEGAFSDAEKEQIISSGSEGFKEHNNRAVSSSGDFADYPYQERAEEDFVFLLSYTEAMHYLYSDSESESGLNRENLRCCPTEYVKNTYDLKLYKDACEWWLAGTFTDGNKDIYTVSVNMFGDFDENKEYASLNYAVRPTIWIKWQDR